VLALLIHMNDFDRRLEMELHRVLDPIVHAPIPLRRQPAARGFLGATVEVAPVLAVVPVALAPEAATIEL